MAVGQQVVVVYESQGPEWPDEDTYAVVKLDGCHMYLGRGPNDEAIHNHPSAKYGVTPYAMQEVINSPWIAERARLLHKDGLVSPWAVEGRRHFLFAFKEHSLDFIAKSYTIVGEYKTKEEAMESAFRAIW